MSNSLKYTQEQLDIALLKNTNEGILRTLNSIQTDMKDQSSNLRAEMANVRAEVKTQGHINLGLILGIYGMIGTAAVAKIFGIM